MNEELNKRVEEFLTTTDLPPRKYDEAGRCVGFEPQAAASIRELEAYGLVRELTEREAKLIQCVKFYADIDNYENYSPVDYVQDERDIPYMILDEGRKAKATLKELGVEV